MNNVNYESTMMKYGVTDLFMSDLTALMLKNINLSQAKRLLSKSHSCDHIDLKQLYVLATSIANSIMGEDLSIVSPEMYYERQSMKSSAVVGFQTNKNKSHLKNKLSEQDIEYLFEEIEDAIFGIDEISM